MTSKAHIIQKRLVVAIRASACAMVISAVAGCATVPEPLDQATLAAKADDNLARVVSAQEPVRNSIDVYEAIARALKYNLDQRVELMQQAVRVRELNLANYQGLPNLVAGSGYAGRDNTLASSSESIITGRQSLEPSTSSERNNIVADITLSWNILDFGLSYVRAKQAADQVLIQQEARRRALNRIVEDVRTAYWRAIASERLLSRLGALESKTRKAIADSRALAAERQTSPVAALTYERELLEIRREAQRIEGELRVARSQLAALMNLPPDARFRLAGGPAAMGNGHLGVDSRKLVRIALMNRPETREIAYRLRINEKEADAALLELLPGVNVFLGANTDGNKFLYHSNWIGWGAKASWNLMKVFQYPAKKDVIDAQGKLLDERSLALTMAIMTQVHVSRARYQHARKELATAAQLRDIQRRLLYNIQQSAQTDRTSEQTLIREQMNVIVSEVRYDLAYANLQNAYANIYASLGLDAFPAVDIDRVGVGELSRALRKTWVARGDLSMIRLAEPVPAAQASAPAADADVQAAVAARAEGTAVAFGDAPALAVRD
ncbi:MAG: TolC family protein [Beijerinckiaceae bacterium]